MSDDLEWETWDAAAERLGLDKNDARNWPAISAEMTAAPPPTLDREGESAVSQRDERVGAIREPLARWLADRALFAYEDDVEKWLWEAEFIATEVFRLEAAPTKEVKPPRVATTAHLRELEAKLNADPDFQRELSGQMEEWEQRARSAEASLRAAHAHLRAATKDELGRE